MRHVDNVMQDVIVLEDLRHESEIVTIHVIFATYAYCDHIAGYAYCSNTIEIAKNRINYARFVHSDRLHLRVQFS